MIILRTTANLIKIISLIETYKTKYDRLYFTQRPPTNMNCFRLSDCKALTLAEHKYIHHGGGWGGTRWLLEGHREVTGSDTGWTSGHHDERPQVPPYIFVQLYWNILKKYSYHHQSSDLMFFWVTPSCCSQAVTCSTMSGGPHRKQMAGPGPAQRSKPAFTSCIVSRPAETPGPGASLPHHCNISCQRFQPSRTRDPRVSV